jgi:hypothetical protein
VWPFKRKAALPASHLVVDIDPTRPMGTLQPVTVAQPVAEPQVKESPMSFTSLIKNVESFASKFEQELAKLWGKAPTIEATAATVLEFVAPIVETIFTVEAGAAVGTAATNALNTIEQKLVAAKGLITAVGVTPTFTNVITGVQSDLSDLLSVGGIKDTASVANAKLVLSELTALLTALPVTTPATPVA